MCSFDPNRIKTDDAKNKSTKILKDYLCYAKAVSESNTDEVANIIASLRSDSGHIESKAYGNTYSEENLLEQSVLGRLQKLGYQVDRHVGNSNYKVDLAVSIQILTPNIFLPSNLMVHHSYLLQVAREKRHYATNF